MKTVNPEQQKRGGWTSASNAAADELCEGRHQAQKGLPEEKNADSDFGRDIHAALAADDPKLLGDDEAKLSIYEQCVDIRTRLVNQFFGDDAPNVKISRHRRLWCSVLATPGDKSTSPVRYQHSGEADVIVRHGKRALIMEYKALVGDIAASPTNKQLRDQVVLAAGELLLSEVGTAIIQPLVTHKPDICLYTEETIKKAEAEMFERVRRSNRPNAKRMANAVSCKFCLARHQCIEHQKWVTAMVPKSEMLSATPIEQWTPEMRTHFLTMKPVVEQWLNDCYSKLKGYLKDAPDFVPGFKLEEGNSVTTVSDPQELFNRFSVLAKDWAAKEADPQAAIVAAFMRCVKIVNEQLKGSIRLVTDLKGKKLDAAYDKIREGITDSKKNQPSIGRDK